LEHEVILSTMSASATRKSPGQKLSAFTTKASKKPPQKLSQSTSSKAAPRKRSVPFTVGFLNVRSLNGKTTFLRRLIKTNSFD